MGGNNCICLWNKLSKEKSSLINYKYFWGKASYDECSMPEKSKPLSHRIRKVYCPKILIFTADENNYTFTIGINPIDKFEVLVRLEHENTGVYIEMNTNDVQQLFVILHQTFHANLTYPSAITADANSKKIDMQLFHHKTYKLCIGNRKIFISMDVLLKIMESETCIKILLKNYETKSNLYGNTVFKLLKLCCHNLQNTNILRNYYAHNKTNKNDVDSTMLPTRNRNMMEKLELSDILDELLRSPCDCLSTTFVIETKVHFEDLILSWIGPYYETRLLSEAIRMNTFKKNWTLNYIDPKILAKSGFFYVGPFDRVQCVFCKATLEKWKPDDDVLGEHKRFAPMCPLLQSTAVDNIPLIPYEKLSTTNDTSRIYEGNKNSFLDCVQYLM